VDNVCSIAAQIGGVGERAGAGLKGVCRNYEAKYGSN
jgi:hypothetical protein